MQGAIRIDARRRLGKIGRHSYGVMIENCGRCTYDGLWVGENSAIPNDKGIRKDVLGLLHALHVPIVRWPGGTPSETYHWREGVGPREKRPRSLLAGRVMNSPSRHDFGTDEYLSLSREVGFSPYLCANVGTGTAEEAANWVEYCNCGGDTTFAALRKANGHPEPYGVKYWGIGNECYFWHDAKSYAKVIRHYAKLMRLVDPSIKLVAAGWQNQDEWNRTILSEAGDDIDYISLHVFSGTRNGLADSKDRECTYERLVGTPLRAEQSIRRLQQMIREITGSGRVRIVMDEYAIWNKEAAPEVGGEQNLALRDALWVAGMIHVLHRTRDCVDMGVMANLVNSTNAVTTRGDRIVCSPAYHALHLYANHAGSQALACDVEIETYRTDAVDEDVPLLDCSATWDDERKQVVLAVVNRSRDRDIDCEISLDGCRVKGEGSVYEINGESVDAVNDFGTPDRLVTEERPLTDLGERFPYRFPAHSITMLEIPART